MLSDHKLKQSWFRSYAFGGIFTPTRLIRHFDRIQFEKNNALYVGVRKGNHQIIRPFLMPKSKARKQIRLTNNALITMVRGTLSGEQCQEEVLDEILRSRSLLKALRRGAELLM